MIKIAIVQQGPEYYNLKKSLRKAEVIIAKAAKAKTDIIAFGECWLTGYAAWMDYCPNVGIWDHNPVKEAWATMYDNAPVINGPEVKKLCSLAKKHNITIVMGMNEAIKKGKGNGSLYNTVIIIDNKGKLANHHRKLMPTYTEKLIHSTGDGAGLNAVDTPKARIGTLICWEHWMPMSRQIMHDEGEDIHFALWPMVKEMHQIATRQYAFEGRCYVVSIGQMMRVKDTPQQLELPKHLKKKPNDYVLRGGSCVAAPDGSWVLESQYNKDEIIYVKLPDLKSNTKEKMNLAVSGHYQRPDVFEYSVNRRRLTE